MKWLNDMRARLVLRTSRYAEALAEIPGGVYLTWQREAGQEFKGIPTDAFFFIRAAEGLMKFFDCVRHSRKPCGLPSMAADSVWHIWLRIDKRSLDRFTCKRFGRVIPHTEGEHMAVGMDVALANTLVTARKLEGMATAGPRIPSLFKLDAKLRMPDGFGYKPREHEVFAARLGADGKPIEAWSLHSGLAAAQLLALGLVSRDAYATWEHKRALRDGASCGGCGFGGGDGGGACGSSCGGGCGGGCGS